MQIFLHTSGHKKLGVSCYETFVKDGHTVYYGANDFRTTSPAKYDFLEVAETSDDVQFKADLKLIRRGKQIIRHFVKRLRDRVSKNGLLVWRS